MEPRSALSLNIGPFDDLTRDQQISNSHYVRFAFVDCKPQKACFELRVSGSFCGSFLVAGRPLDATMTITQITKTLPHRTIQPQSGSATHVDPTRMDVTSLVISISLDLTQIRDPNSFKLVGKTDLANLIESLTLFSLKCSPHLTCRERSFDLIIFSGVKSHKYNRFLYGVVKSSFLRESPICFQLWG